MVFRARTRLGSKAPTLGLFVDWLEDGYQTAVVNGVLSGARAAGASVVCFAGGAPGADIRSAPERNHVFELANAQTIDALIVMSGGMANYVGGEGVARFIARFGSVPCVSIALDVPGIPSVMIDNLAGMRSVLDHLLVVHGFSRVAFVRGPVDNDEAEGRYRAYREVLAGRGIALDERLVVPGTFDSGAGREAVRELFDARGWAPSDIHAIVAANDSMAFGVLEELARRGLQVPRDLVVTGFDDVEDTRYAEPPLTTVRQPLDEQGREAVRLAIAALQARPKSGPSVLRTELVVRESCGCFAMRARERAAAAPTPFGFEASLVGRRQQVLVALTRASRGTFAFAGGDWEVRTVTALAGELRGDAPGTFIPHLENLIERLVQHGADLRHCHDVLTTLREEMLPCLGKDPERRALAEDLFQQARMSIGTVTERVLGRGRLRLERWARALTTVSASLIGGFDMAELRESVKARFPELGIQSCFIARYSGHPAPSTHADIVLAYDSVMALPDTMSRFPVSQLLPPELLVDTPHLRSYVVMPLFFRRQILGYALIELNLTQAFAYEALRDLLSAAVKGAELVAELDRARPGQPGRGLAEEGVFPNVLGDSLDKPLKA